jgi:replicative DNA helicase
MTRAIKPADESVRELPKNVEAEQLVLGALLLRPAEAMKELGGILDAADFFVDKHRIIFRVIIELTESGAPCDVVSVANKLTELGKETDAGGRLYINDLMTVGATATSVAYYAEMVKQKAARRGLIEAGARLMESAYDETSSIEVATDKAAAAVDVARREPTAGRLEREVLTRNAPGAQVRRGERALHFVWDTVHAFAEATNLKEHTDGKITGMLTVGVDLPGTGKRVLKKAQYTFTADSTRSRTAKDLDAMPGGGIELGWTGPFEELCRTVIDYVQEGSPLSSVDVSRDTAPVRDEYLLFPLLTKGHPTVLYGSPGGGKSYIAEWIACLLLSGARSAVPGIEVRGKIKTALYLDYEGSEAAFRWRAKAIHDGTGLSSSGMRYRRCSRSLVADVEQLQKALMDEPADLIVVDSLALAAGGDLNASQGPLDFYSALRSLGGTALIIGHSPKSTANTAHASLYGSIFFTALPRAVWQLRADGEENQAEIKVAIFQEKVNYGPRERPVALTIKHDTDGTVRFYGAMVEEVTGSESAQTIAQRIFGALKEGGAMTIKQLAESVDESQDKIRAVLSRMRRRNQVTRLTGTGVARFGALVFDRDLKDWTEGGGEDGG